MLANDFLSRFLCVLALFLVGTVSSGTLFAQPPKVMNATGDGALRTELAFWESIKDSTNPKEFEAYIAAYPKGYFASLARIRIGPLTEKAGVAEPSTPPGRPPMSPLGEKAAARSGKRGDMKPGSTFRHCETCPQMVVIPAGRFQMGSDSGGAEEKPPHPVAIPQAFAMGVYEVTVGEWDACVKEGGCPQIQKAGQEKNLPVSDVSWDDSQKYVKWLSDKTGRKYRLPSEGEWEYAARGGTATRYWWGDKNSAGRANCTDCGSAWDGKGASPVGSFEPNPLGLYDVQGNVWEWTQDCWNPSYVGAPNDGTPRAEADCLSRVLRGGSWALDHDYMRASRRNRYDQDVRYNQNGFRVVSELVADEALPFAEAVQEAANAVFSEAPAAASRDAQQSFVIDPLIDGLSGAESAATRSMESRIADHVRADYGRFQRRDSLELNTAASSQVLIGTFTGVNKERKTAGVREAFRICLALLDLNSGKVVSKAKVFSRPDGVDITPAAFFRDSPAWVADASVQAYIKTCQATKLGDPIDPLYLDHLKAASLIRDAIAAYEGGRYAKAKELFKRASHMKGADQLRTYNGLYLTSWKLGEREEAAQAFGKIVDYGLANHGLAVKFPFRPDSTDFATGLNDVGEHDMWLAQIAQASLRRADCLEIVGHTSRTGTDAVNERLSIRRAKYVKQRLVSDAPALSARTIATGKGSQENLIGSGTGDMRDALDRRIEFDAIECPPTG